MTEGGVGSELAFRTKTICTTAYATCPPEYAGLLDGNWAPAELLGILWGETPTAVPYERLTQ